MAFFSRPKDFAPACTPERGEFDARNTRLIGLSVDSMADHKGWAKDVEDVGGSAINYPLLADPELEVAKLYGVLHPKADFRVTVLADAGTRYQAKLFNPAFLREKGIPVPYWLAQAFPPETAGLSLCRGGDSNLDVFRPAMQKCVATEVGAASCAPC